MRVLETWTATGSELLHNQIYIAKYLLPIGDDKYKHLGDTTVLAREMIASGCRPRLKNARA